MIARASPRGPGHGRKERSLGELEAVSSWDGKNPLSKGWWLYVADLRAEACGAGRA
jgi:hypothetical protein